jgi:hypothetical protein
MNEPAFFYNGEHVDIKESIWSPDARTAFTIKAVLKGFLKIKFNSLFYIVFCYPRPPPIIKKTKILLFS